MIKTSKWINEANTYTPGLSVEEIKEKYSLKTVYKLASNENPLPPDEGLLKALAKQLKNINRYPSYVRPVIQAASRYYGVDPEQLVLGNGSSELIDKLMQAYGEAGSSVLISEKTFPLYALCAQIHRLHVHKVSMGKNLKVNIQEMLSVLHKNKDIKLVFISNPNNPTGSYVTHSEMEKLLSVSRNRDVLIILDEAYQEYVRAEDFPDSLSLLKEYPHLVLLRSMSKIMGLAGLRAGLMLAHTSIVRGMKKVICPFNVNALALQAMYYCFSNKTFKKYLLKSRQLVWEGLDYFYHELDGLGLKYYPSQGSFLLFSPGGSGAFSALLERGLILRPLNESGLEHYLRMSVGLKQENKKAIELIKELGDSFGRSDKKK